MCEKVHNTDILFWKKLKLFLCLLQALNILGTEEILIGSIERKKKNLGCPHRVLNSIPHAHYTL